MEVFIPFSEVMVEKLGLDLGRLVPFQLEYECLHLEVEEQEHSDSRGPRVQGTRGRDPSYTTLG
ncbi:MAG: hypothetical protein O7C67_13160 [Gammaproteobacteria bacterium]|nr:hypothetical protein [Gammaproteobacteria bacterium]